MLIDMINFHSEWPIKHISCKGGVAEVGIAVLGIINNGVSRTARLGWGRGGGKSVKSKSFWITTKVMIYRYIE